MPPVMQAKVSESPPKEIGVRTAFFRTWREWI
jgi:hypothetical protein